MGCSRTMNKQNEKKTKAPISTWQHVSRELAISWSLSIYWEYVRFNRNLLPSEPVLPPVWFWFSGSISLITSKLDPEKSRENSDSSFVKFRTRVLPSVRAGSESVQSEFSEIDEIKFLWKSSSQTLGRRKFAGINLEYFKIYYIQKNPICFTNCKRKYVVKKCIICEFWIYIL